MKIIFFVFLLVGCTPQTGDSDGKADSRRDSRPQESGEEETAPPQWPLQRILTTKIGELESEGLQLATGLLVPGDGDLRLNQAQVLSLITPGEASICVKGVYDSLAEIPTDTESCPGNLSENWLRIAYLSASTLHTEEESDIGGLGMLLRNEDLTDIYRLRMLGDSYNMEGVSTATFMYEPVESGD